jgi:AMP nucleosidase
MKSKQEIVDNWLPRYTGATLDQFGKYVLLTNFSHYVNMFAKMHNVEVIGKDRPMQCATAEGITIINFGMGSPGAATIMDLLTAIQPEAVLFLGKCGGLKKRNKIGDLILPIASSDVASFAVFDASLEKVAVEIFGAMLTNLKVYSVINWHKKIASITNTILPVVVFFFVNKKSITI